MARAGVVLARDGCVRTSISVPSATPVTHATPVTSPRFCRSQPYQTTFPGPCGDPEGQLERRTLGADGLPDWETVKNIYRMLGAEEGTS